MAKRPACQPPTRIDSKPTNAKKAATGLRRITKKTRSEIGCLNMAAFSHLMAEGQGSSLRRSIPDGYRMILD
jgi:hypothetical protein